MQEQQNLKKCLEFDRSIAYHEAGHAVMAYQMAIPVRSVRHFGISGKRGEAAGVVEIGAATRRNDQAYTPSERWAISLLAGNAAQRRFSARSLKWACGSSDLASVKAWMESSPFLQHYRLPLLEDITARELDQPLVWDRVELVASELLSKKAISARTFQKLMTRVA